MEKKFGALRFIGSLYKVIGIIVAVVTVISALGICATSVLGGAAMQDFSRQFGGPNNNGLGMLGSAFGGLIIGLIVILNGGLLAVGLYAIGEGIYLLLSLEANTRATTALLQQRGNGQ
jgi:hypothetical protein